MEKRAFRLELRDADNATGRFAGYASVFDVPIPANRLWHGMDEVVDRGAFAKTLQESKGQVPILAGHDTDKQIGLGVSAVEDRFGLLVEGKLFIDDVQDAREEWSRIRHHADAGRPRGLSIGFQAIQESVIHKDAGPDERHLSEVALFEYSSVAIPAQPLATVEEMRSVVDRWQSRGIMNCNQMARFLDQIKGTAADSSFEPDAVHSIAEQLRRLFEDA